MNSEIKYCHLPLKYFLGFQKVHQGMDKILVDHSKGYWCPGGKNS